MKKQNLRLAPGNFVGSLSLVLAAGTALAPAARAESGQAYKRILVVDDGGASPEAARTIADGVAGAVERAVSLNVARQIYGRRAGAAPAVTSPLAFVIRSLEDMNVALNETFMTNSTYEAYLIKEFEARSKVAASSKDFDVSRMPAFLRLGPGLEQVNADAETHQMTFEVLTLPVDVDLPGPAAGSGAAIVKESGIHLVELLLQSAKVSDAKEFDQLLDLYDQADSFTAVSSAVANDKGLYRIARDTYVKWLKDDAKAWMPLYLSISIAYGPQGVVPSARVILRPGPGMGASLAMPPDVYNAQPPAQKIVDVRTLDFIPHFSYATASPAAMSISVTGAYGSATRTKPIARINFGRLPMPDDIRVLTQCLTACNEDLTRGNIGRHYPTINGNLRFEFVEVIAPSSAARGFWGRFKEGVKRRINSAVQSGAKFAGNLSEKSNFHLLIQQLAIEVSSDSMRVLPTESIFTLGIGDGNNAVTINPVSNSVAGVDLKMFGLDMYGKVAPEISAAFSTEINAKFSKDKLLNDKDFDEKQVKILKALEPIVKALNSY